MHNFPVQKFNYIDSLRAFAILGVILFHVSQWISPSNGLFHGISRLGSYGVQLFFITSALTLFKSVSIRNKREPHSMMAFLIRRFFRIAPMFYAAMVIYQLYNTAAYQSLVPEKSPLWHFIVTALFLHGWHPATINTLVPGCWSIAVEMTFYLCLPILFVYLETIKRTLYFLFISIVASKFLSLLIAGIIQRFYLTSAETPYGNYLYYWFFSQLPVFVLGIGLYHVTERITDKKDTMFGLFLISGSIFLYFTFINYSCWGNLIPQHLVYGFIFCIFATGIRLYPFRLFVNSLTKGIGKISFSLYLTHFMVLDVLKKISNGEFPVQGDSGLILVFFAVLVISSMISILTYFSIEKPGIKLGHMLIEKL